MEHPDHKYINALINNNEPLLRELYGKCFGKIKFFITNNHGTDDDAWDILQEAMLSIFYRIKRAPFNLTCPFDAFIYIVCRNLWLKELRKKQLERVTLSPEMECSFKGDDDLSAAEECKMQHGRRMLLLEKLNELEDGCRQLLQHNWRGLQLDKVAEKLNITYAYARKRKSECMAKLVMLMKKSPKYDQLKW
jgi:RNA polymerase sigma factor (sigma-70 family)